MRASSHLLIEKFIREHLGNELPFNASNRSGDHTGFIAAAAKQQGLIVKPVAARQYVFFDGNIAVGGVHDMVTSLVSMPAVRMVNSKPVSKQLFASAGVPVAPSGSFSRNAKEQALQYFIDQDAPVVVKPSNGREGKGITAGIETEELFESGWQKALNDSPKTSTIMVEQYVQGLDVRALVVGDRVVAAATRLPAFVEGNGRDSIDQLVEADIKKRATNAYLHRLPISVDDHWLNTQNLTRCSVPGDGTVVTLNSTVNLHQGGEHVDVTDMLVPELKQLAVRAAQAIPGLAIAGIDLLVKSLDTARGAVVLEANASANISVHHLPAYGQPVDVATAIVNEMIRRSPNGRLMRDRPMRRIRRACGHVKRLIITRK